MVMNIQEDRSGLLWIGTYVPAGGGGLARLDRTTNSFYRFPGCGPGQSQCPQPAPGTVLPPDFRTGGIYEDGSGNMWFNGSGSGLIKYDRQSNEYQRFICDAENPDGGIAEPIVGDIIEDDFGRLWFDDRSLGLTSFNPVTGAFNHYRHDPADPSSIGIAQNEFLNLFQDKNGTVWVAGTTDNLSKFDPNSSLMAGYKIEPGLPANSSGHYLSSLAED
jgi:streptogramin lyase